ncbi:hypothetical protein Gorai_022043 [Gossypium raimondii]|uniref:Uncharacterized protein n=1 Tax=Gossypium raimondii TaxID=29730 RepID=A0A7J8NS38_GOSRA|nr:hypothetical protein [Gossypium raimondii]
MNRPRNITGFFSQALSFLLLLLLLLLLLVSLLL